MLKKSAGQFDPSPPGQKGLKFLQSNNLQALIGSALTVTGLLVEAR